MTALSALADALDDAGQRIAALLLELDTARREVARLERRHEADMRLMAEQAALINEWGAQPAEVTDVA